jgi:hypothetical protein
VRRPKLFDQKIGCDAAFSEATALSRCILPIKKIKTGKNRTAFA